MPCVFVYHRAPGDVMIPYHVLHGMSGAVMVLPRDGLKDAQGKPYKYDRAYCIGEQDYYIPKDESGNYMGRGAARCPAYRVEGLHQSVLSVFVRDPASGGCAAGAPPANVSFRLVVAD